MKTRSIALALVLATATLSSADASNVITTDPGTHDTASQPMQIADLKTRDGTIVCGAPTFGLPTLTDVSSRSDEDELEWDSGFPVGPYD